MVTKKQRKEALKMLADHRAGRIELKHGECKRYQQIAYAPKAPPPPKFKPISTLTPTEDE